MRAARPVGDAAAPFLARHPTEQPERHSWSIHRSAGSRAQLIGIVHNQPDDQSAIAKAIEEYDVPANQRGRLIAQRRD